MSEDNSILEYFVGTEPSIREEIITLVHTGDDAIAIGDAILKYLHSKGLRLPNGSPLFEMDQIESPDYRAGW